MNQAKLDQKGMTLVEVLVTTAIAAMVMVAIANSLVSLYQHEASVKKRDFANELSASLARFLHNNTACTQALSGQQLRANATSDPIVIRDFIIHMSGQAAAKGQPELDDLRKDAQLDTGIKVVDITIANSSLPDQNVKAQGVSYVRRIANINLRISIQSASTLQTELKPHNVQIPVLVQGDKIVRCAGEMEVEDACDMIGSTYDPATGQCVLEENCYLRGTYSTSVCSPSTGSCPPNISNIFTRTTACPSDAVESKTGEWTSTYRERCGKKCTRRIENNVQYFLCLSCK